MSEPRPVVPDEIRCHWCPFTGRPIDVLIHEIHQHESQARRGRHRWAWIIAGGVVVGAAVVVLLTFLLLSQVTITGG